ncbi:MAG: hypothetical protein K9N51_05160, partial [Candidatus Pacebacteria bacterium]|nr:hypothetical protein [Candidatus Paceibacterota bacterium]
MFSKALVAVDSSPAASAVVACARDLHRLGTKKAVLVQCFMIPEHVAFPDEIKSSVEESLEPHRRHFHERGIETEIIA